jgi:prephenate dehydrogenase
MKLVSSWRVNNNSTLKTLNIIGAGRVGRSLAHLWHKEGVFAVQDVLTRSQASADEAVQFIAAGRAVTRFCDLRAADVWMLAVPDGQIKIVVKNLARELLNMPLAGVFIA